VTVGYFVWGNLKAKSHLEEARALVQSEDWVGAFFEASKAQQSDPSLEGARLVLEAAQIIRSPDVTPRSIELFEYEGANQEDRRTALKALVDFRQVAATNLVINQLTPEELKNPQNHFEIFRSALFAGDYTQAIKVANEQIEGKNPEIDLMLANGLAQSGLKSFKPELNRRLRSVIQSEDRELALRGLDLLVLLKLTWVERTLAEEAISKFGVQEELKPLLKLHLESLKAQLGQQDLEESISKAIEDFREDHLGALVVWLDRLGRYQKLLELTSDAEVQKDEVIFLLRLSALENEKQWEELQGLLEEPPVDFPEPLRLARLAMASVFLEKPEEAKIHWDLALVKASEDKRRNWFYQISQIAGRAQNQDVEMEALTRAIIRPYGMTPPSHLLEALYQWLGDRHDEERILKVSSLLLERLPSQPIILSQFFYQKALYQTADLTDLEPLKNLVELYPENIAFLRSLAFVQLQLGQSQNAFDTLSAIRDIGSPDDLVKALRARSLFDIGYEQGARDLSRRVNWSELTPRERQVLRLPLPKEVIEGGFYQSGKEDDSESLYKLVETYPKSSFFRRSLALGQYREGLHLEALETLDGLAVEDQLEDITIAIRGRILFALERQDEARELVQKVDWGLLSEEERNELRLPLPQDVADFLERLAILEKSQKWLEMEELLEDSPASFPRALEPAFRALAQKAQGKTAEASSQWQLAMEQAGADLKENWFDEVAEIAGRAGHEEIKMESILRSVIRQDGPVPDSSIIKSIKDWLIIRGEESRLLDFNRRLFARRPNDPSIVNHYYYLKALYQSAESRDVDELKVFAEMYPKNADLRRSLAFGHWAIKQYQEALEEIQKLSDEEKTSSLAVAIHTRILFSLNQEEKARGLAEVVDWSQLSEKEVSILSLPLPEEDLESELARMIKENKVTEIQKAVIAYPKNQRFLCSLAYVQLKLEKPSEALQTIRGAQLDNFARAIRARGLFGILQEKAARDLAKRVNYAEFTAQENEILQLPPPEQDVEGE